MARKRAAEHVVGTYSAMPHSVMDSVAFAGASHPARSLLFELIRQLNGRNNGHLKLATGWLRKRGWSSADVVQRAKAELIVRQLAIKTYFGGLNAGPDLWAVTWLPISDFTGLSEVSATTFHPGAWHFLSPPIPIAKCDGRTVSRNSTVPSSGIAQMVSVPSPGTKTALFEALTVPPPGNIVDTNGSGRVGALRVVGKRRSDSPASNGTKGLSDNQVCKRK